MSKKINIFVGNVGSAYIDKETAQKNVAIAQQNIQDCQALIDKANGLITKINAAKTIANLAKQQADGVKSVLENVIGQNTNNPTKLNKLSALQSELINNDTDGIALNGGNVRTANSNIANLNRQLTETQSILEDALSLKEDNEKLLITRQEELTNSTNEFNSYMPEPTGEDQTVILEGELEERINNVQDNIDLANETSQAINDTTQDVYNRINEITSEPDEDTDIVLRQLYWYAGQRQLSGDVFKVTEDDCTENIVDTWHVLTVKKVNDSNFIIAGIDSNSDVTTWNVVVPKDLNFTPVKADLTERDTNWTEVRQVTVNDTQSILYEVNNEVSKLTSNPVKRLNVLMSTDEIIEPEPTGETGQQDLDAYGYWYIGTELPTQPYMDSIAANLVTDDSDVPGWRKIERPFETYTTFNKLYDPVGAIILAEDFNPIDTYIILPVGFVIIQGDDDVIDFPRYNQIVINDVIYNVYKYRFIEFGFPIFYKNSIEPTGEEPTGEEPTGEEPTGEEPTGEEPTGEEPTGEEPTGEEPTVQQFKMLTHVPTVEDLEDIAFDLVKPTTKQIIDMSNLSGSTEVYFVYPLEWEVIENNAFVLPKIYDQTSGLEMGFEIFDDQPTITVNDITFRICITDLGKGTFEVRF